MKLYKFHRIDKSLFLSLAHSTNWYSRLENLNDPFEGLFIDNSGTETFQAMKAKLLICSFSKVKTEVLMWSHYADEHRGCCLEFQCDADSEDIRGGLFHIEYDNNLVQLEKVRRQSNGALLMNVNSDGKWLQQKLKYWKYEKEARKIIEESDLKIQGQARPFPGKLSAIYFGIRSTDVDMKLIKNLCHSYSGLKFYKVSLNKKNGRMSAVEKV